MPLSFYFGVESQEEPLATHDAVSLKPVYYITHAITRDSPLYNKTEEDLLNEKGFIAIVLSATDDQTFQVMQDLGVSLVSSSEFLMKNNEYEF